MDIVVLGIRWKKQEPHEGGEGTARLNAVWNGQAAGSRLSNVQGQDLLEAAGLRMSMVKS